MNEPPTFVHPVTLQRRDTIGSPTRLILHSHCFLDKLQPVRALADSGRLKSGSGIKKNKQMNTTTKKKKQTSTNMAENGPRKLKRSAWSRETEQGLLVLWQDHPCLYDVSSLHYHDRIEKERAWREIANCLQQPREQN